MSEGPVARALLAIGVLATAWLVGATPPADAAPASDVAHATGPVRITLPTGDAVLVPSGDGVRPIVEPAGRRGWAGHASIYRAGGDEYVIPAIAARYVDRVLDRGLFDVTALAAHPQPAVRVDVAVPSSAPAVPGLTVTSRTATGRQGYFTRQGARRFGAALAEQNASDAQAHQTPTRLFGGVTRIAPTAAPTHPARPAFPQHVLTIHVTDAAGKPADLAGVALTNVDDGRKFGNFVFVVNGVARISVPDGYYSGFAEYDDFATSTGYLMTAEEVHVTGDDDAVMRFDARTATVTPSVQTPRPAALDLLTLEWDRNSATSRFAGLTYFGPGVDVRIAPGPRVTRGTLHWVTGWALSGTPRSGAPYRYDLSFDDTGAVPADQHRQVRPAQLARVAARYYTDGYPQQADFGRQANYPFQLPNGIVATPFSTPLARTEYVGGSSSVRWDTVYDSASSDSDVGTELFDEFPRSYRAGASYTDDWGRGPLAPGIADQPAGAQQAFYFCDDCRDATSLNLQFWSTTDTVRTHRGAYFVDFDSLDLDLGRFRLYRDGTLISAAESAGTRGPVPVPAGRATYRAVVSSVRSALGFRTSTTATTDLTFVSSGSDGPAPPASWPCPNPGTPCHVLPLLQTRVPLPTGLTDAMRQGSVPVTFTVGHVQGATNPSIGDVHFAISNGGRSYRDLPVTSLGGGRYRVTIVNPASAAGQPISVRVSAADAAGGRLVQTTENAYVVAQS